MMIKKLDYTSKPAKTRSSIHISCFTVAHGANELEYSWKYGNNQSIVVNEDVKLSQFELISYSHVNGSTILKDSELSSLSPVNL